MTPGARVAAAISIMDEVLAGAPAERTLTRWARGARYAGSKDRAAVRDLVFGALRRLRSSHRIGGPGGRGTIVGALVQDGADLDALLNGAGHAPPPLSPQERDRIGSPPEPTPGELLDLPDWLLDRWWESLGQDATGAALALRDRAPVHLRANLAVTDADGLLRELGRHGIEARRLDLSPTAVDIVGDGRALRATGIVESGRAELQDAASQAVADMVPAGGTVLDFCAGGGGKSLAIAARGAKVTAHDADPSRMSDLPERARRAGALIEIADRPSGRFDAVLVDAPCSGAGAWRRQPEAKWRLTEERLAALTELQGGILATASDHVTEGGTLTYATCSMLDQENRRQVDRFLQANEGWRLVEELRLTPINGGDGFYAANLTQRRVEH